MVASSIPCKISLCADRAHARAGDSYVSSPIDVACPTTQNVLAIASPHELQGDYWPSSSTGTSSFCCNQQYSVTAITTSTGAVAERYAYTAYGQPTILDASGTVLPTSNFSLRTSYTGREWDATLALHQFRARWMSPTAGRFLTRDPIGYEGSPSNFYVYCISSPLFFTDSSGLIVEKRTVCIYRLLSIMINSDNPPELCAAEFEIERVCQMGKRDDFNHPRHRDGWYYWPVNTFTSTYIIEGGIHPDYCGPCAGIYISLNGLPKNGNIPPQNTDTGWVPEPPVLIPL